MSNILKYAVLLSLMLLGTLSTNAQATQTNSSPPEKETKKKEEKGKKFRIKDFINIKKDDSTGRPVILDKAKKLLDNIEIGVEEIMEPRRSRERVDPVSLDSVTMRIMEEVLVELDAAEDSLIRIEIHDKRGAMHHIFGNKNIARESYEAVYKEAEHTKNLKKMGEAKFNIGNTYFEEGRYQRAKTYYTESMGLFMGANRGADNRKINEKLAALYVKLAQTCKNLGEDAEAIYHAEQADRLSRELGDKNSQALANANFGTLYKLENNVPKALEYHQKALENFEAVGNDFDKITELKNVGELFLESGDVEKAEVYLKEAKKTAETINSSEQLKETYLSLSKSAEKRGNEKEALLFYREYERLKDSLQKEREAQQMKLRDASYEVQKRQAEIEKLHLARLKQQNFQIFTMGGMGLLFLLFFSFWQRSRYQQQKKEAALEQQRTAELQKLDQMKDQFLANTSHELRTPLNGIIGLAESLCSGIAGKLPAEAVDNLNVITRSGRRLSNLVNDILDFSKIRNNDLHLNVRPIDLYAATDVVLALSRPLIESKSLVLHNEISKDTPLVDADEDRLQQILHNLIGNAIKFTEEGVITIKAEEKDDFLAISVIDTGIGIPEDKHEAIFHAFSQGDGTIAREYGGAGLGLSVSRQLIELHGGSIRLNSKEGEGSCFTFTLPLSKSQRENLSDLSLSSGSEDTISQVNPLPDRWQSAKEGASNGASIENSAPVLGAASASVLDENAPSKLAAVRTGKLRILIVDDEPVNLKVLNNHLSLQGYEVVKANNGQDALTKVLNGEPFDLIVLDIMMPRMSGYEVCHRIRARYSASELPIVMLTAKNRVSDLVEGFDVGANDYIAKPFSRDELLSRIKIHLGLNRIQRASSKFIPLEFLRSIGRETITEVKLGDQAEKVVTVFFSDIRDYTTLSETMTPAENFQFVRGLNARMGPVIQKNQGFVNQYLGDAIMAIFPQQPQDALHAAIDMHKTLRVYNQDRHSKNRKPIRIGVGMHTGPLIMGVIGDDKRMDAATISDTVNTASRIESLTKHYGGAILLSEASLQGIPNPENFHFRRLGPVQVKGKHEPIVLFECFDGDDPTLFEQKRSTLDLFQEGLTAYYDRKFAAAAAAFENLLQQNSKDKVARLFLQRARRYAKNGAPAGWTGIEMMKSK